MLYTQVEENMAQNSYIISCLLLLCSCFILCSLFDIGLQITLATLPYGTVAPNIPFSPRHRALSTLLPTAFQPHLQRYKVKKILKKTVTKFGGWEGRLTKTSIWVLCLDSLTPVLAEEHVCGQCTLGCLGVLLGFCSGSLLSLLSGFALCRDTISTGDLRR